MKKYYVFLFGIIFIFIFTGCSFLSFNSPFGACVKEMLRYVRPPRDDEKEIS